jgi:hypothetical protein
MKKILVFLDIDYTIYNSKDAGIYRNKKISQLCKINFKDVDRDVSKIYKKITLKSNILNPALFIIKLSKHFKIDKNKLFKIIWSEEVLQNFLFNDVIKAVSTVRRMGDIIIFSQGNRKFQNKKLFKIKKYLKKIHIFNNKLKNLKKIINIYKNKKIFIIDDWPLILKTAKKIDKNIITIQMYREKKARKYPSYNFIPDIKVKSLKNLYKILKLYSYLKT